MRFMLTFRVPPEVGNTAMKDGRFNSAFQSVVEELQPEAAYFTLVEGARGGYLVVTHPKLPSDHYSHPLARP